MLLFNPIPKSYELKKLLVFNGVPANNPYRDLYVPSCVPYLDMEKTDINTVISQDYHFEPETVGTVVEWYLVVNVKLQDLWVKSGGITLPGPLGIQLPEHPKWVLHKGRFHAHIKVAWIARPCRFPN